MLQVTTLPELTEVLRSILREELPYQVQQSVDPIEKPTDVEGAAEHLQLDEQTIYRLVRQKKIPFAKQGRKLYFFKSELNDWIKSGKAKSSQQVDEEAEAMLIKANRKRLKHK